MDTRSTFNSPAFAELAESNGVLMVWVNKTLLPDIAITLEKSSNSELRDFSTACRKIHRQEEEAYDNNSCKITAENRGARITLQPQIGFDAIRSFINTPNRAIAKIGFDWRNLTGESKEKTEIRWRGRRDYFINGVNVPAQAATITFNRSALAELIRVLPDHPFRAVFTDLASILDIDNEDVNNELDEDTAAVDEKLMEIQR